MAKTRVAWCFYAGHWCYDRAAYSVAGCSPACRPADPNATAEHCSIVAKQDDAPESFVCPRCGFESFNPSDKTHRYCVRCHEFFD
jgi:hypothetical protein